jgi:hypothetical protein
MTCGYGEGVDGINTARPLSRPQPRNAIPQESKMSSVTSEGLLVDAISDARSSSGGPAALISSGVANQKPSIRAATAIGQA